MIETFGWWGLGFSILGLIVSSYTLAYYLGHRRGLGQFRLSNPFGPAPIVEKPDPQIVLDYRAAKAGYETVRYQYILLEKQYKQLKNAYDVLEEKSTAATKRAARRAMEKEISLGK